MFALFAAAAVLGDGAGVVVDGVESLLGFEDLGDLSKAVDQIAGPRIEQVELVREL